MICNRKCNFENFSGASKRILIRLGFNPELAKGMSVITTGQVTILLSFDESDRNTYQCGFPT
jgi:hypothetical protein